ncbi:MAG: 2-phosphosulfolactate phosphatase [Clostridiaceae bacterium]|jgi:2-phosphosulfolactate phosphatase|nr:2-phosphosulfolactate phosphatase [Clostridiaceae bacterium]
MKIDIIISSDDIKEAKIKNKSVVVIDMLRATSVITTAIANGCTAVIPVLTIEEAFEIANRDRNKYILGGERRAVKIDGFDCSNSPLEYTESRVKNKTVVMTTTNGTRAIKGCHGAKNIIIGAMINSKAVANRVTALDNDITLVNAGTYGEFSIDDFICSGYIIDCILKIAPHIELSDVAKTAHYIYNENKGIYGFIEKASHYKTIKRLNLEDDLKYCCRKDTTMVVPEYKEGIIVDASIIGEQAV